MADSLKFESEFNSQFSKYKGFISEMRKKVNDLLSGSQNIEKLMSDKVEDYILLEEQPMPIIIGDRTIFIGNFTWETEQSFFEKWAKIISLLGARIINYELSDARRKELLEKADFHLLGNAKYMLEFIMFDKWLFKQLCKLIDRHVLKQQRKYLVNNDIVKTLRWKNCSLRYFKKHITKEKLLQICYLIFFFNFTACRQNVTVLLDHMNMKSLGGTYMYNWLKNLRGVKIESGTAAPPSIDAVWKDSENYPIPESHKRKKLTIPSKDDAIINAVPEDEVKIDGK